MWFLSFKILVTLIVATDIVGYVADKEDKKEFMMKKSSVLGKATGIIMGILIRVSVFYFIWN